jgi:hypothetical protein
MSNKNTLLRLVGIIFIAVLAGMLLGGDEASSAAIRAIKDWDLRVAIAPLPLSVKPKSNLQTAIATLADGNYQFCSQPQPSDRLSGAGVCFNFAKIGDRVDGYYGYPHSDDAICLRGKIDRHMVRGEALAISWPGREWTVIPKTEFNWDAESHLALRDGKIIRTSRERGGRIDWISFRHARLDTEGFYQYSKPHMTPPDQLCKWD